MRSLLVAVALLAVSAPLFGDDVVVATRKTDEGEITTYSRKGRVVFTSELRINDGANPRVTYQTVWVGQRKLIEADDFMGDVRRWIYPVDGIQITEIGFGEHQQLLIEGDSIGYLEVFDVTPEGLLVFRGYDTTHVSVGGGVATVWTAAKKRSEPDGRPNAAEPPRESGRQ